MRTQASLLKPNRDLFSAGLCLAFIVFVLVSIFVPGFARAEETAILRRGDAVVTGFSGASERADIPSGVATLDRTFLDTSGTVARIFDLTRLGAAANSQLANAPVKFSVTAGEIGQVFGVALDSDSANRNPNVYLSATSLYGLQIVSRNGERLVKGEAGAKWMDGQFGSGKGGGPGSVWKIDGATGAITLFANLKHEGRDNSGPGLGAIAYDPASKQLFVTDLETGHIHRLGMDGSDKGTFDHGVTARAKAGLAAVAYDPKGRMDRESPVFNVEDAKTWGFTDKRRRVVAATVQSGRLYYSADEGPVIWSVGIGADGDFADDARLEIDVTGTPAGGSITGIAFDGSGEIYLTQRGEITGSYDYALFAKPQTSAVLRYSWNEKDKAWSDGADETPIGLEPPHRSTLGGIALNYGYDSSGSIDYGRCRETLWTTGEHLREGDAGISAGGARIVHGIQGNLKSLARAALISHPASGSLALQADLKHLTESGNEPPREAWFVDYDDRFDDADAYGHVGSIAVFNPCDKRLAAEPKLPQPGPFPLPAAPGIYIAKQCFPGPIGANIRCVITVTNVGITSPPGPITFSDFSTILAGPGAGAPVLITSAAPDWLEWLCAPTPTASFSCALTAAALPPGASRSVTVFVDTAGLLAAGNSGFRNCASLGAPYSGVACDEGGTEITVIKKAPAACLPGAACTFEVAITNSGTAPFTGDVLLSDSLFQDGGGAPVAAPITAIVPALACAPLPAALPFNCVAPLTLLAGQTQAFAITVTMPAAPANYWARNCFTASAPGLPPPALPPGPEPGTATSCAWVPVGAPGPLSNLRVVKAALACDKLDPMTVRCDYEIAIKNDGPSDYNGPVTIKETVPVPGVLAPLPAPWICLAGTCGTAGAVLIPSGGQIIVPVAVDIPRVPLEAAKCWAPNTAEITAPVGGNFNFNAADDADTATGDAALIRFDEGGPAELVLCDPTNLKVSKVALGDCGAGTPCTYKVTVTNIGPDPFKGTLKVKDTFSPSPASVAFPTPGWGCAPSGAGFECTRPNTDFKKGESIELTVIAKVADSGRCELKNTATLTAPAANTRWNLDPADDTASASAKIKSSRCEKNLVCEPGPNELRSYSGACLCKRGFEYNSDGRCVAAVTPPKLCADGSVMPKNGICPCPAGTLRNRETGACVPVCEPGPHETKTSSGQCVCIRGFARALDGRCMKPDAQKCPDGSPVPRNKVCPCPEGTRRDPGTGQCRPLLDPEDACKRKGWIWRNNECHKPSDPAAECKAKGWTWRNNECFKPSDPAAECKAKGWTWRNNECFKPSDPAADCKAKGWTWRNNECFKPSDPAAECKAKGWTWRNNECFKPSDPAAECTKSGGKWIGKTCIILPTPAEVCAKRGGKWDGKTCVFAPSPADECKKKGGAWNGKTCVIAPAPAEVCAKRGGKWDGKTCVFTPSPADACRKKGWIWTGNLCVAPPPAKCPPGTTGTPPNCKKIELQKPILKQLQLQQKKQ